MKRNPEEELTNKIQEEFAKLKEISFAQNDLIESLKRKNERLENLLKYKDEEILKKLICVLDDIELFKENEEPSEGVNIIFNKLTKILSDCGLKEFDNSEYKKFDDELHNAIDVIEYKSDLVPNNYIDEVRRKGYRYNDKVIRHADVVVTK